MAGTTTDEQREELFRNLANLEAAVETPCVPGEMERWIDAVHTAWQEAQPLLNSQIGTVHPQVFAQIGDEDAALLRRVERMRQEDAALVQAIESLGERTRKLRTAAANLAPDEAKLRESFDEFVEFTLDCIIRIRTQEQAIRTWLMEAFSRDRGAVD